MRALIAVASRLRDPGVRRMCTTARRKWVGACATGARAVYASVLHPRMQWLGTTKEEPDGNLSRG
jgi:hypothetical protein